METLFKKDQEVAVLGYNTYAKIIEPLKINKDIMVYKLICLQNADNFQPKVGDEFIFPEVYLVDKERYDAALVMMKLTGQNDILEVLQWQQQNLMIKN
jgi:hypothetical protein